MMRYTVILLLMFGVLLTGPAAAVEPVSHGSSVQQALRAMVGERQRYTLDFMVFKDLAEGQLQLTADNIPGRYRAELAAHTLGVASWLTGDRTQRYGSVMEADAAGRLRSLSYESSIHKRKFGEWSDRQKRYRFDYQAGKVYQETGENGQFAPGLVFELPKEQSPVDMLTGFYNLRAGVYGALTPGAQLKIPTFTAKGMSVIEVEVLTGPARLARPFFPAAGVLLQVRLDPEMFNTGGADLYVWFDETGRPARGIVENVIGLGNVYGHLREEQQQP
jgi:hypothetical protein